MLSSQSPLLPPVLFSLPAALHSLTASPRWSSHLQWPVPIQQIRKHAAALAAPLTTHALQPWGPISPALPGLVLLHAIPHEGQPGSPGAASKYPIISHMYHVPLTFSCLKYAHLHKDASLHICAHTPTRIHLCVFNSFSSFSSSAPTALPLGHFPDTSDEFRFLL